MRGDVPSFVEAVHEACQYPDNISIVEHAIRIMWDPHQKMYSEPIKTFNEKLKEAGKKKEVLVFNLGREINS